MTANCRSRNIGNSREHGERSGERGKGHGVVLVLLALWLATEPLVAQTANPATAAQSVPAVAAAAAAPRPTDPVLPPGYVIGTDDVLSIVYWKDKDMSSDAQVRPDGRIALPLINEVQAAGLTPEQLREKLTEESKKYMEDASITVVVRQINSRKAFITGEIY